MKRRLLIASLLAALLIVVALYGSSLSLPYFYDDVPTMAWLRTHSWIDIVRAPEGGYYRPLPLLLYRLPMGLALNVQTFVLRLANLLWLVLGALLVRELCLMCTAHTGQATVAGALYLTFPFLSTTVPWISANSHLLVVVMVLLAAILALRAKRAGRGYVLPGLLIFGAIFMHESGAAAGVIVGGVLLSQSSDKRAKIGAGAGVVISVASLLMRPAGATPPVATLLAANATLTALFPKVIFFLQSLLYPMMPAAGELVHSCGWNDFALVVASCGVLLLLLGWLVRRDRRNLAWIAPALIWWALGSAPAALSFTFPALYVAPRLYALGSVGPVLVWSGVVVRLPEAVPWAWPRRLVTGALLVAVTVPGMAYIYRQQTLFTLLGGVYSEVVSAVTEGHSPPVGFVNLPYHVAWNRTMYPLIHDGVVFVPWYSSLGQYIHVNTATYWGEFDPVIFGPVTQEHDPYLGFGGRWVTEEELYAYALAHQTVYLTRPEAGRSQLAVREVGAVSSTTEPVHADPIVTYTGGPDLLAAELRRDAADVWALTLWWNSTGPVGASVFVHVYDQTGALIAQADGPALSGLLPLSVWQPNGVVRDVRYLQVPDGAGDPPFSIGVGLYDGERRFPALVEGQRVPNDSAVVAVIQSAAATLLE